LSVKATYLYLFYSNPLKIQETFIGIKDANA